MMSIDTSTTPPIPEPRAQMKLLAPIPLQHARGPASHWLNEEDV